MNKPTQWMRGIFGSMLIFALVTRLLTACSAGDGSPFSHASPASPTPSYPATVLIPPSAQILDVSGNAWTLAPSTEVYINGAPAGISGGVILIIYYQGVIYQENQAHRWWYWDSTLNPPWTEVPGDPREG